MRIHANLFSLLAFILLGSQMVPPVRADYKEAVALYNRGEYEKAIQELQPDLENNRDWEFGHRLLGLCYLNLNNNALAASSLSRAVDLKSTAFSTYLGLAQAYFNMQKYSDCITALDLGKPVAAKDKDPAASQEKLFRLRGSANYRLNKFKETVDDLTQALRLGQAGWTDYTMLGVAYFNLDRHEEAVETLEKTLSMNPDQPSIKKLLGKAYLGKGTEALAKKQFDSAAAFLKKAQDYDPQNGFIYYNLAETYLFEKKYSTAEEALNEAKRLMPENAGVFERLGLVYEKMKKWDQALNAYKKAQEINPSASLKEAIARAENNKKQ
jgi:tetratricopeptide (TPR) repeat protein